MLITFPMQLCASALCQYSEIVLVLIEDAERPLNAAMSSEAKQSKPGNRLANLAHRLAKRTVLTTSHSDRLGVPAGRLPRLKSCSLHLQAAAALLKQLQASLFPRHRPEGARRSQGLTSSGKLILLLVMPGCAAKESRQVQSVGCPTPHHRVHQATWPAQATLIMGAMHMHMAHANPMYIPCQLRHLSIISGRNQMTHLVFRPSLVSRVHCKQWLLFISSSQWRMLLLLLLLALLLLLLSAAFVTKHRIGGGRGLSLQAKGRI